MPQLRPWPDLSALPAARTRQVDLAYQAYVAAYTKALAIDHPAGAYTALAEAEKAPMRAERWDRANSLEQAYTQVLQRALKPKSPKAEAQALTKLRTQHRLFADDWPPTFDYIAARFPHRPRVSHDLQSSTVRPIDQAAGWRYIQYNTPAADHLLIVDYDCPKGVPVDIVWREAGLLPPAWVAATPGTGRGHLAWSLATPVCTTSAARLGPLRYLASIEEAYRQALTGDPGFAGLLTKNPIHPTAWETRWIDPTPRSLAELAAVVQLAPPNKRKVAVVVAAGLGRKVQTFDAVRHWAYTAVSEYWARGALAWSDAVRGQVDAVNLTFSEPLPESHLRSISKSIAKWVWKRFTPLSKHQLVIATHTPHVQAMRGRLKGAARRNELLDQARQRAMAGEPQHHIAQTLGIAQSTISRWLRRGSAA